MTATGDPSSPQLPWTSAAAEAQLPRYTQEGGQRPYLPLELWREPEAAQLFRGDAVAQVFLSSGTTGGARSTSRFSTAGLGVYRAQSLTYFFDVLGQVLPPGSLARAQGLSLVPSPTEWDGSSLAQMVAWIGEVLPLRYTTPATLADDIAAAGAAARPVWLFATAFHLMHALDSGYARPLPPGSVVIETGGTKGRSRELSRQEFYAALSRTFAIPETAIVSEYGMCELACQAYDFVPFGAALPHGGRRFRFPRWTRVAVLQGPGVAVTSGHGALVVDDPLRIDFPWPLRTEDLAEVAADQSFRLLGRAPRAPLKGCSLRVEAMLATPLTPTPELGPAASPAAVRIDFPWPLRTEDLAEVAADQSFRLLGRAPRAPLKGCSLRVEAMLATPLTPTPELGPAASPAAERSGTASDFRPAFAARLTALLGLLADVLGDTGASSPALQLLATEIGSTAAAAAAVEDIKLGLPKTPADWLAAVDRALGSGPTPEHWLVILPENHSLVGLYPLAMAYLAGLRVSVRLPRRFATGGNLLQIFARSLRALPQSRLQLVPPEQRLGSGLVATDFDAVLCYASDETLLALRQQLPIPVQGFGHRLGISVVDASAVVPAAATIVRDALGLGQSGCMASRLLLIADPQASLAADTVASALQAAGAAFWQSDLPWMARVGLEFEACRLARSGSTVWSPATNATPLCALRVLDASATFDPAVVETAIARAPWTLSAVALTGPAAHVAVTAVCRWLASTGSLGTVGLEPWPSLWPNPAPSELPSRDAARPTWVYGTPVRLGMGQTPSWNGSHENRALFDLSRRKSPTFK